MKKLLAQIVIILSLSVAAQAAEWLVCDIPTEQVSGYWVSKDTDPAVWIDYKEIGGGAALYDITNVDSGTFQVSAQNDQGRRSAASDPFALKPVPLKPGPFRIVQE